MDKNKITGRSMEIPKIAIETRKMLAKIHRICSYSVS
jgi:hypothetical protein